MTEYLNLEAKRQRAELDLAIAEVVAATPDSFIARDVADNIGRVGGYEVMPQTVAGAIRRQPDLYVSIGWGRDSGRGNVHAHYSNNSSQVYRADREALQSYLRRRGSPATVSAIDPDAGKTGAKKESHMTGKATRLPTSAEIHLDGGTTLYAAEPDGAFIARQFRGYRNAETQEVTLDFRNTDGEPVVLSMDLIVSVVGVDGSGPWFKDTVVAQPGIFDGRKITVRGYPAYAFNRSVGDREGHVIPLLPNVDPAVCVVVAAEDLAGVEVLIYDLAHQQVVWQNPASADGEIERVVRAVQLLAEAETINVEQHIEERREIRREVERKPQALSRFLHERVEGLSDIQNSALASIENGDGLKHAIEIAGAEFVAAYLGSRAQDEPTRVSIRDEVHFDHTEGVVKGLLSENDTKLVIEVAPGERVTMDLVEIGRVLDPLGPQSPASGEAPAPHPDVDPAETTSVQQ